MTYHSKSYFSDDLFAVDIVKNDYRTANIFYKYGIEYCCGAKWPLKMVCEMKSVDINDVIHDLEAVTRTITISNTLPFHDWKIGFLSDYIINVHHQYLIDAFPRITPHLTKFTQEHESKYPFLKEVMQLFNMLKKTMIPHLKQEEEIIFPYVKQIAHAYESKESYAGLLVRTLRKPIESVMKHEHDVTEKILQKLRTLTDNYTPGPNACVSHKVAYSFLKEIDDDIQTHMFLENDVLFPKAIAMEKELLENHS